MALIHPEKVWIGYKLDQNTNLVSTFDNDGQKCKKVKIQRNMDDFHWKISIPGWKSRFVKNHEKRKNSLPDCPIWLIFRYVGPHNHQNKNYNQIFEIFIFQRKIAVFWPKKPILDELESFLAWKMLFFGHFLH